MGWKKNLRRVESAARKAQREAERSERKLSRGAQKMQKMVDKLEKQVQKDVIGTFNLRFDEDDGLTGEPVHLNTDVFQSEIRFPELSAEEATTGTFEPERYEHEGAFVKPLGLLLSPWATLLALKVGHGEPEYRIKLNWVHGREKEKSSLYLVDPENNQYYYPTSTTLKGEVLPERPRVGLVAFEPMRKPTSEIEVHFSDMKLTKKRGERSSFQFTFTEDGFAEMIADQEDSFGDELRANLRNAERDGRKQLQQSGCMVVLFFLGGGLVSGAAVIAHTVFAIL